MRKVLALLSVILTCTCLSADDFLKYREMAGETPFILISKKDFKLTLVGENGESIAEYGCAVAKVYGPKEKRGDGKTPEGVFKINQLLNSKDLYHDFKDGKGPIAGAYGPWFLRLDVPGIIDIGIHGTHLPESIGTRATEGCVRLRNEDIVDLKGRVKVGTPVIILPEGK